MEIKPQTWTHHHTHRMYHMSLGLCFGFAALAVVGVMATVWMQAGAVLTDSGALQVTATVGDVNPGPVESTGGGGGPVSTTNPTITIQAEPVGYVPQRQANIEGQTVNAYVFSSSIPKFSGITSVPQGLIFIKITGSATVNSTAQANSKGEWYWESNLLPPGQYRIVATVYDSYDLNRSVSATAYFIKEQNTEIPDTSGPIINPVGPTKPSGGSSGTGTSNAGQADVKFGVFFKVLDQYKYITSEKKVIGSLMLVSTAKKNILNQEVNYKVIDPNGVVILDTNDLVSFTKQSQFVKTFFIAPNATMGKYKIVVSSTYSNIASTASDTFTVLPVPAAATTQSQGPVVIWILLPLLWLLFMVLVIIAYRRVRFYTGELSKQ